MNDSFISLAFSFKAFYLWYKTLFLYDALSERASLCRKNADKNAMTPCMAGGGGERASIIFPPSSTVAAAVGMNGVGGGVASPLNQCTLRPDQVWKKVDLDT